MRFFTNVATTYGGIARIRFGRNNYSYLVSEPALIRELLIDKRASYMKNVRYKMLRRVLGEGLLLSEGAEWTRQRKIVQPAFRPQELLAQLDWSSLAVSRFLDRLESKVSQAGSINGSAIDIEPHFARLAQLLAGTWLMGEPFRKRADRVADIFESATSVWPEPPRSAWSSYRIPNPRKVLKLKRAFKEFDQCIFEIIEEYRNQSEVALGIMPLLVDGHQRETGQALSNQQLRDQLVTLFIAAHETSASAQCWIHYLLSLHPDVRARMYSEVDAVLEGRLPTAKDLDQLQYVGQVIQEALRIYSPIHSLSRVAVEDNTIGGYHIPKGGTVIVSLFATHRLPEYWENPEAFDPERFTEEQIAKRASFAYIPFAAGHRNCIGGTMATIQSKIIVSQIAQRFTLDLAPGHPVEMMPSTTMRPRFGMKVYVRESAIARKESDRELRLVVNAN